MRPFTPIDADTVGMLMHKVYRCMHNFLSSDVKTSPFCISSNMRFVTAMTERIMYVLILLGR